jgi:hypothetical protein
MRKDRKKLYIEGKSTCEPLTAILKVGALITNLSRAYQR